MHDHKKQVIDHIQDVTKIGLSIALILVTNTPDTLMLRWANIAVAVAYRAFKMAKIFRNHDDIDEIIKMEQINILKKAWESTSQRISLDTQKKLADEIRNRLIDDLPDNVAYTEDDMVKSFDQIVNDKNKFSEFYGSNIDLRKVCKIFFEEYNREILNTKKLKDYYAQERLNALKNFTLEKFEEYDKQLMEYDLKFLEHDGRIQDLEDKKSKMESKKRIEVKNIWGVEHVNRYKIFEFDDDPLIDKVFISEIYTCFEFKDGYTEKEQEVNLEIINDNLIDYLIGTLDNQRFLPIIGGYGSGKTILSKVIYKKLSEKKILALDASQVYIYYRDEIFEDFINYIKEELIEYLIIDSIDDIDFKVNGSNESQSILENIILELIEMLENNKAVKLLVNGRELKSVGMEINSIQSYLYECFLCSTIQKNAKMVFVVTQNYNAENRNKWLSFYFDNDQFTVDSFNESIKQDNKKAKNSLMNPLMLYISARYYNKNREGEKGAPIDYLKRIVTDTINGRFVRDRYNGQKGALGITGSYKKYENLVTSLCFDIVHSSKKYNNIYAEYEFYLDSIFSFSGDSLFVKIDNLTKDTENLIKEFDNNEIFRIAPAYLWNCYFWKINIDNKTLFMKDINLLYYLAAQRQKDILIDFIDRNKSIPDFETFQSNLYALQFCGINSNVFDFLLKFFKNETRLHDDINNVFYFIYNNMELILMKQEKKQKDDIIEKVAFLYVLFVNVYIKEYNNIYKHVFKDINKISKLLININSDKEFCYTLERYFRNIKIKNAIIKRINLKHYNFKGTHIEQTIFSQCKLFNNSFEKTLCDKIDFRYSSIVDVDFSSMDNLYRSNSMGRILEYKEKYNLKFTYVSLKNIKISNIDIVIFKHCNIDFLEIEFGNNYQLVYFENCSISNLIIKSSKPTCRTYYVVFDFIEYKGNIVVKNFGGKLFEINEYKGKHPSIDNIFKIQEKDFITHLQMLSE